MNKKKKPNTHTHTYTCRSQELFRSSNRPTDMICNNWIFRKFYYQHTDTVSGVRQQRTKSLLWVVFRFISILFPFFHSVLVWFACRVNAIRCVRAYLSFSIIIYTFSSWCQYARIRHHKLRLNDKCRMLFYQLLLYTRK